MSGHTRCFTTDVYIDNSFTPEAVWTVHNRLEDDHLRLCNAVLIKVKVIKVKAQIPAIL
jgi:hypothetical protein